MACGKVPDSDRYKTDSNLQRNLTFPVYPHIPTHARSAALELLLRRLAKELLCAMQQIQFFSALQCGTRFVLLDGPALYLLFAKPIQLENPPLSYRMWPGASLRPIQNRQQSLTKSYLPCVPIHSTRVCSAPLELFLQSLAKKLLCVMQQKQRFSNLQFGTRSVLWERFFILFVVRKNDIA